MMMRRPEFLMTRRPEFLMMRRPCAALRRPKKGARSASILLLTPYLGNYLTNVKYICMRSFKKIKRFRVEKKHLKIDKNIAIFK
jgi:hypothetical protein